jgi:hypothetical protein
MIGLATAATIWISTAWLASMKVGRKTTDSQGAATGGKPSLFRIRPARVKRIMAWRQANAAYLWPVAGYPVVRSPAEIA